MAYVAEAVIGSLPTRLPCSLSQGKMLTHSSAFTTAMLKSIATDTGHIMASLVSMVRQNRHLTSAADCPTEIDHLDIETSMSTHIKPGPKPKRDDGNEDRRRHVNPENKPKHPSLPIHKPEK